MIQSGGILADLPVAIAKAMFLTRVETLERGLKKV